MWTNQRRIGFDYKEEKLKFSYLHKFASRCSSVSNILGFVNIFNPVNTFIGTQCAGKQYDPQYF